MLRIEMQASRMPKEFPLDTLESATEFEFIRVVFAADACRDAELHPGYEPVQQECD